MTRDPILQELRKLGLESYRKVIRKHGAPDSCLGVKIEDLKKIQKRVGRNHELALSLYDTGIYDAMYLAGLIADDAKMTPELLQRWVEGACRPLIGSTVAWVTAGSPHGWEVASRWIESDRELEAAAGWAALGSIVAVRPDDALDLKALKRLLQRVHREIHGAPNQARYQMNAFVIAVGCFVAALKDVALETSAKMGPVSVDLGDTECQVPAAAAYIRKVEARGSIGKKRKSAKC
jgi:hypothetical protein